MSEVGFGAWAIGGSWGNVAEVAKHPLDLAKIDARFYAVKVRRGRVLDEGIFGRDVFVDFEVAR